MTSTPTFWHRLRDLGPLRLMLLAGAIACLVLRPAPGTAAVFSGWAVVPSLVVPIVTPLAFAVLLLDALMARVMMSDPEHRPRNRYRLAITLDLLLATALIVRWLPYFRAIAE